MRVTILTFGSRGDVQPYVALGLGLTEAGHDVCVATHEEFRGFVVGHGLRFAPVGRDPREILGSQQGQSWLASGRNPARFMWRLLRAIEPVIRSATRDSLAVCEGADLIIDSAMGIIAAEHVAEKLEVPLLHALVQPLSPTRTFPNIWFPKLPASLDLVSRVYNIATHFVALHGISLLLRSSVTRTRRELLGLSGPVKSFWTLLREPHPVLYGYSPTVVPKAPDWTEAVHVTGSWFLDRPRDWQPPSRLADFLASGPAPVFVGFGSMMDSDPAALTRLTIEALARARRRGLLYTGWGGLSQADAPEHVFMLDSAPITGCSRAWPRLSTMVVPVRRPRGCAPECHRSWCRFSMTNRIGRDGSAN